MSKVYKFSEFFLDTKNNVLYRQNAPLQISSRAFEILAYLIERRGNLVEKEEILEKVWSDSFVEEANLAVQISALRRILGENKGESRFIKTVSGRGYRFVAEVEEVEAVPSASKNTAGKKTSENESVTIAVLPFAFKNGSAENEFLAGGVTQSLIGDLAKIQNLRVLAFGAVNAYKNSAYEIQEIGFLLGVDRILTGSISEFDGKWEISAELINTRDKSCLWATSKIFAAEDAFEVKKEISSVIIENLKLNFDRREQSLEIENEAQKLYYRGKFILESRTSKDNLRELLYQALKFFKEAIRRAPNYALAYVGCGSVFCSLNNHNLIAHETAQAEAVRALQMALASDSKLSEAYVLKGAIEAMFNFDVKAGLAALDVAINLGPSNADAYHWKSLLLLAIGKFDEAFQYEKKAVELDPITIRFSESLTRIFYYSRKYNEAIVVCEELLEFNREIISSHLFLALSYTQLGFFELAMEEIEKTLLLRNAPDIAITKACILARFGKREEAETLLLQILADVPALSIDYRDCADVYAELGETDKAFEYLNKALAEKKFGILFIKIDPHFRNLRSEARFNHLLETLNLQ